MIFAKEKLFIQVLIKLINDYLIDKKTAEINSIMNNYYIKN